MLSRKQFICLCLCTLGALTAGYTMSRKRHKIKNPCTSEKNCTNMKNNCQCYCSVKCGFRDKTSDDRPVYVQDDPNGKYCYCKQWDLDNYKSNECDVIDPEDVVQAAQ